MSKRFSKSSLPDSNHLTKALDERANSLYSQATLQGRSDARANCKGRATEMATQGSEALAGPQSH